MLIDYDLLRSFVQIGREKNFSRAARKRRVSQSAISQQIKTLEGQLGIALFRRDGRRMRLTIKGEYLFEDLNSHSNPNGYFLRSI